MAHLDSQQVQTRLDDTHCFLPHLLLIVLESNANSARSTEIKRSKSTAIVSAIKLFHQGRVEDYLQSSIKVSKCPISALGGESLPSTSLHNSHDQNLHRGKHVLLENMRLALPNLQHFQTALKPFCLKKSCFSSSPQALPMCRIRSFPGAAFIS